MKTVSVKVQGDHLESLARSSTPIDAVAELIWNSLDADATVVTVRLQRNVLGGLESITIADNGNGIAYQEAIDSFESLGGSWKRRIQRTPTKGRLLHGKQGKGRFKAFALGASVRWRTRFNDGHNISQYEVIGSRQSLQTFELSDPKPSGVTSTGTEVDIADLVRNFTSLLTSAVDPLTEQFALYLRQYPDIAIFYDGTLIDPAAVEAYSAEYQLAPFHLPGSQSFERSLTIIEWTTPNKRNLFLCDGGGFTLHELPPGIQAPGFSFSAYVRSDYLRDLDSQGAFLVVELHPDLQGFLVPVKDALREHFRKRSAASAAALVEKWKEERVYPYTGKAASIIEEAERQVFDVLALSVNEYLPDFDDSGPKNKRLAFELLREAIGSSPTALQRILRDVLNLPEEKQRDLASLLERTSLEAIINASKLVADRLDLLTGLETLIFDEPHKSALLERRQLHRVLAEHTWIFGEEFNLTVDDRSLTAVLAAHLRLLGREPDDLAEVRREDGRTGLVDLMLSRSVPQSHPEDREHLVVELKRPLVVIDMGVMTQVQSYATAVARDERFRDTNTRWIFWAVSNEIDESVRQMAHQRNRAPGLFFEDDTRRLVVWVKTWGELVQDCKARLHFFQTQLRYAADNESAMAFLRATHAKYLPPTAR